jgi:WD40 repeat protein
MNLSSDGATLASNQSDGSIAVRSEAENAERSLTPKSDGGYTHVRFNSTGQTLTAGDGDGVLRQWAVESGELKFSKVVPGGGIREIALCPDDSCIAVIALNGGVFLYDGSGDLEAELQFKNRPGNSQWSGKAGNPWSLAVSRDGKLIAAGSVNGEVIVWERSSRKQLYYGLGHLQEQVVMVAFSPDGKLLASACFDGTIKIWQLPAVLNG